MGRRDAHCRALTTTADDPRPPAPERDRRPVRFRTALVLAWTLALALGAVVVVRLTGSEQGSLLVLLVGALPLTLLGSYLVLAAAVWLRAGALFVTGLALAAVHAALVAPAVSVDPLPREAVAAERLRVVVANLYAGNPRPAEAGELLLAQEPDLLVVPELTPDGLAGLRASGLLDALPHAVVEFATASEETTGLFSRLPLRDVSVRQIATRTLPQATVEVAGTQVRVLAAHPLPPVGGLEPLWRAALDDLAAQAAAERLPLVVAGDLNADRDHAAFRALLDLGLQDAHDALGRGLATTWPARFPVLHLDHVLVRDGVDANLAPVAVREIDLPGSDHLGVVADVAVLA